MQKELEEVRLHLILPFIPPFGIFQIKEAMISNEQEHKQTVEKLEQKFFEEKMRLQQESNKKIEEIASRAQDEALKYEYFSFLSSQSSPLPYLQKFR